MENLILPALYLAPIPYYQAIKNNKNVFTIEKNENFRKQTYRNRIRIGTASGPLNLTIPIQHHKKGNTPIKDIRINYDFPWQRQHWLSIQTAYRSSAYFEFYEDAFHDFYHKQTDFLFDFNIALLETTFKLLKVDARWDLTESYVGVSDQDKIDYRDRIHPRVEDPFPTPAYYQVFQDRTGFIPGLSIFDLICNQGPRAWELL